MRIPASHPLAGRKLWIPRMTYAGASAIAAVFRSLGIDAECTPPSDERTRELGARYTCGDECYPTKVTLGDFLRILEQPGTDPRRTAFFMATGQGPCRFGQYVPHLKSVLAALGYPDVLILSPTGEKGYSDFGEASGIFVRSGWRALVAADILSKYLLKTRPYEVTPGSADAVLESSLRDLCHCLETPYENPADQLAEIFASLLRARERFRALPLRHDSERPLIGVVGEIFCRLNTFSNDEIVRRLEEFGGEAWMSDVSEWIWYTNSEETRMLRLQGKGVSLAMLGSKVRAHFQKKDEEAMISLFLDDFRGCEEPESIAEILDYARPYLPVEGATGEMVVNVGRSVYLARKGVDGILDISPFSCMNGIICEAIYPRVSRDNGGIPIRNFYFDGTQSDLERDIGIYLELARSYRTRKLWHRAA